MEMRRIPDERCVSTDERGHDVRLKVNPNVRIPGTLSEFLRDSTNAIYYFNSTVQVSRRVSNATVAFGRYNYRYVLCNDC